MRASRKYGSTGGARPMRECHQQRLKHASYADVINTGGLGTCLADSCGGCSYWPEPASTAIGVSPVQVTNCP